MKSKLLLLVSLVGLGLSAMSPLSATEKPAVGPNGGRLLHTDTVELEFFVTPTHHAELTFCDDQHRPAARTTEVVTLTTEGADGRTKLELKETEKGYVTVAPLPEAAEPYRVVVQVRVRPDAKPQNFRIDLNLATCGECQHPEYACTCEGH